MPFNDFHFLLTSFAPITADPQLNMTTADITKEVIQPTSALASCDPREGKYVSTGFMYRNDVIPRDIRESMRLIKTSKDFTRVDWACCYLRCGIGK